MELRGIKIGFVLTGSFSVFQRVIPKIKELIKQEAEIVPIMSFNSYNLDTKFGKAEAFVKEIEEITSKKIIRTISEAEPIGIKNLTDIMIIAPCSRKHYIKACLRYYRYTCSCGSKITLKK